MVSLVPAAICNGKAPSGSENAPGFAPASVAPAMVSRLEVPVLLSVRIRTNGPSSSMSSPKASPEGAPRFGSSSADVTLSWKLSTWAAIPGAAAAGLSSKLIIGTTEFSGCPSPPLRGRVPVRVMVSHVSGAKLSQAWKTWLLFVFEPFHRRMIPTRSVAAKVVASGM